MNDELLTQFLQQNISISWYADAELDQLAEAIDKETGARHDRQYSRGYSAKMYPYVVFDKGEDMLVLYRYPQGATHYDSVNAFLADLCIADEDATAIDIENLL